MRRSSRDDIVDAAIELARKEGVSAVTFEAVAKEANVSRGGIIYHFPSKDDLLVAIVERIAGLWEAELMAALGKPYVESTASERIRAYLEVSVASTAKSDIAMMIDPAVPTRGEHPAHRLVRRWAPTAGEAMESDLALRLYAARLVADGLWLHSALDIEPVRPELQQRLVDLMAP